MHDYLSGLFSLEGQTALIAGGAGAIGSIICEAFAKAGATVIVLDLQQPRLDQLQSRFADEDLPSRVSRPTSARRTKPRASSRRRPRRPAASTSSSICRAPTGENRSPR